MTERRYVIVIEGGEDADYSAYAPDLPGCVATGATLEECERNNARRDRLSRRGAP